MSGWRKRQILELENNMKQDDIQQEVNRMTESRMNKVIRDGKVAVLVSPGHGAGWSTWNSLVEGQENLLFDPDIVECVERGDLDMAQYVAAKKYPNGYWGGADQLTVCWVPVGTHFRIHEYDGFESVEIRDDINWVVA